MTRFISLVVAMCAVLLAESTVAAAQPAPQPSAPASAQDAGKRVRWNEIVLKDGSRILGTIVSENEEEVVLKNQSGTVVVAKRADIASINQVTGDLVDGRLVLPDPNATRLFFGPTGRSLAR